MVTINQPKFKLGTTVATPGAIDALEKSNERPESFLKRHLMGSWGDVCKEDAQANDDAVAHEGNPDKQMRVLSSYKTNRNQTIWIITEWDRSVTTLLLPSEY
ncbi:MAG: hypothetical protein J7L77_07260 [Clostridiales bacterium]|nr:hypothetical protein [Clostridiales bacterium]